MAIEREETVRVVAQKNGLLQTPSGIHPFGKGDSLNWPAHDAKRSETAGLISIVEAPKRG